MITKLVGIFLIFCFLFVPGVYGQPFNENDSVNVLIQADRNANYSTVIEYGAPLLRKAQSTNNTGLDRLAGVFFCKALFSVGLIDSSFNLSRRFLQKYKAQNDFVGIVGVYGHLSWVYHQSGQTDSSLFYDTEVVNLLLKEGDPEGALPMSLSKLAMSNLVLGNLDLSLVYLNKSFQIQNDLLFENERDLKSAVFIKAYTHYVAAKVYHSRNEFNQSIFHFKKAVTNFYTINSFHPIAMSYLGMGDSYNRINKADSALVYFNKALLLHEEAKNKKQIVETNIKITLMLIDLGEIDDAIVHFKKVATQIKELYSDEMILGLNDFTHGRLLFSINKIDESIPYFRNSYSFFQKNNNLYFTIENLTYLLKSFVKTNDQDSVKKYKPIFDELVNRGKYYSTSQTRVGYFGKYLHVYDEIASYYIKKRTDNYDLTNEILNLTEQSKARVFYEDLQENSLNIEKRINPAKLNSLKELNKQIIQNQNKIDISTNTDQTTPLKNLVDSLKFLYNGVQAEIKSSDPVFKNFIYQPVISLDESRSLIGKNEGILSLSQSDSFLICLYISKSFSKAWQISLRDLGVIERSEIFKTLGVFQNSSGSEMNNDSLKLKLKEISQTLFAPIIGYLEKIDKLYFTASGFFALIPIEALYINNDELISELAVSYLPSVSFLKLENQKEVGFKKDALVFANPDYIPTKREVYQSGPDLEKSEDSSFFGTKFRGKSSLGKGGTIFFLPLPESESEAKSILSTFPNSDVFTGENAAESQFGQLDLSSYRYIHFAVHCILDAEFPEQSGLVLSQNDTTSTYDGIISLPEIYQLKLNSDLIVLSACKTVYGENIKGEGIVGMQRPFLYAGARNVLVSLWDVPDKETAIFMANFYSNLQNAEDGWILKYLKSLIGLPPKRIKLSKVLQETKMEYRKKHEKDGSLFWASFILIGAD
ncbi:MAG: CHAT domain-containing protein [Bacteroidetes bacterium]|nr:CHAT domain-containing protein [Bacteroidota bacterium]